jgi:DNA-binding transcriptional ArsR family regulator
MTTTATDELSSVFAALADPTRRAMLDRLRSGETTLNDLASPFQMSVQAVSQHLKVLERAGLVTRGRLAQTRPARLSPAGLQTASGWLESYREFWEASFGRLDEYLQDLQAGEDRP